MNCPICTQTALVMSNRQNVEIDYCPQCRGVWLDRGELDKLMELAVTQAQASIPAQTPSHQSNRSNAPLGNDYRRQDFEDSDYRGIQTQHGRRKKSWLNEIFD
jgi:uncharacterized protein